LSFFHRLRLAYLCYFSKPAADRAIYRAIRRRPPRKIVELGIGDARRAMRMIELAKESCAAQDIHYVGMDPFEGRADADGTILSLKNAHQLLRLTGVRIQLVPGNPADSLIRLANSLGKVDLLSLPPELAAAPQARAWFFVPRVLHEGSIVYVETLREDCRKTLRVLPQKEIERMVSNTPVRRAA